MNNADQVVSKQPKTEALPPYAPEELQRIAFAHVDRYYFLPPQAREDAAGAFILAALEACERARPGPGIRSYQYRAGLWAAGQFVRDWGKHRNMAPASLELMTALRTNPEAEEDDEPVEVAFPGDAVRDDPLERMIEAEEADQIRDALSILPARSRRIVEMHVIEGMTFDQIGRAVNLERSRAYRVYDDAIRLLREEPERRR